MELLLQAILLLQLTWLVQCNEDINCSSSDINLALNKPVFQSSTKNPGCLAVDGDPRPSIIENNQFQCAFTKPDSPDTYAWWQIDLGRDAIVNHVIIYSNISEETEFSVIVLDLPYDYTTLVEILPNRLNKCTTLHSYYLDPQRVILKCNTAEGGYLTIFPAKPGIPLILCEVEVYGISGENLAYEKPTTQSSEMYNGKSSLAVDGTKTALFHNIVNEKLVAQCTHTSEEVDLYPWWRVDLQDIYIVELIKIYNRDEFLDDRLHDLEIRVGLNDISVWATGDEKFTLNGLCVSILDKHLAPGSNTLYCSRAMIGRFVSIQIIQTCATNVCSTESGAHVKNILTVCEVEVFGNNFNPQKLPLVSLSVNKPQSHTNLRDLNIIGDDNPWFMIDLKSVDIVYEINFEVVSHSSGDKIPTFEIRIGNHPITSEYNNQPFSENNLCAKKRDFPLYPGRTDIFCQYPIFGRYVTLQFVENCNNDSCKINMQNIFNINRIEVQGYEYNSYIKELNIARSRYTKQSFTGFGGVSSLAVDQKLPEMSSLTEKCALTLAERYPWWRVDLLSSYVIHYIIILISVGIQNYSDTHLIQIFDIGETDSTEHLVLNGFCYFTTKISLHTYFYYCGEHSIGRYVQIELNAAQVLQLCEVEVHGCR